MPWGLDLLCAVSSYLYSVFDIYKTPGERKYGLLVAKSWSLSAEGFVNPYNVKTRTWFSRETKQASYCECCQARTIDLACFRCRIGELIVVPLLNLT